MKDFRSGILGSLPGELQSQGRWERNPAVTIVGGGIAGLLLAHRLQTFGNRVEILEAADRLGGLIHTFKTPLGLVESAAQSFVSSPELEALLETLALKKKVARKNGMARYIFSRGCARKLPVPLPAIPGLLWKVLRQRQKLSENPTVAQWAREHLGEEGLQNLVYPMVTGIFAGNPEALDFNACFPTLSKTDGLTVFQSLRRLKRERSAEPKGPRLFALDGGTQALVNALAAQLETRVPVAQLHCGVKADAQEVLRKLKVGPVVLTTPAQEAAQILKTIFEMKFPGGNSQALELIAGLKDVEYAPLLTVTLFINKKYLHALRPGVGLLRAKENSLKCLGILTTSESFGSEEGEMAELVFMYGGMLERDLFFELSQGFETGFWAMPKAGQKLPEGFSQNHPLFSALKHDLRLALGWQGDDLDPSLIHVFPWPCAIPQYTRSLASLWPKLGGLLADEFPGLCLFGNYTGQVSIRGMVETVSRLKPPSF